jgi:hypothetical protein
LQTQMTDTVSLLDSSNRSLEKHQKEFIRLERSYKFYRVGFFIAGGIAIGAIGAVVLLAVF